MILDTNYIMPNGQTRFSGESVPLTENTLGWVPCKSMTWHDQRASMAQPGVTLGEQRDEKDHVHIWSKSPRSCTRCDAALTSADTGTLCFGCKTTYSVGRDTLTHQVFTRHAS